MTIRLLIWFDIHEHIHPLPFSASVYIMMIGLYGLMFMNRFGALEIRCYRGQQTEDSF